jgi:hypothetical protein
MSDEPFAVSKVSAAPAAQVDYDSICAALMDTARGRWFLQEYARRTRGADTQLLLAAIRRIEAVVCAERNTQAQQGFRTDLIEMAKAITRTRAEVAEIGSDAALHAESGRPGSRASPLPQPSQPRDVFAAAERIRDVTWAMRGHGFDPSTCDQLEELAASILSASSLRDPADRRASKLSEVLQYLEHRIDTLLESSADGSASAAEPPAEADHAFGLALGGKAEPANGFAGTFVTAKGELDAADFGGGRLAAPGAADPSGLDTSPRVPDAPPSPAIAQATTAEDAQARQIEGAEPAETLTEPLLATAPPARPAAASVPQSPPGDPLAALKAMSGEELIALFS